MCTDGSLLARSCTHARTHVHARTHARTHALTHSLAHSLTRSLALAHIHMHITRTCNHRTLPSHTTHHPPLFSKPHYSHASPNPLHCPLPSSSSSSSSSPPPPPPRPPLARALADAGTLRWLLRLQLLLTVLYIRLRAPHRPATWAGLDLRAAMRPRAVCDFVKVRPKGALL